MYKAVLNLFSVVVAALIFVGCSQPAPIADSPEARLEQARALTAIEVESGALDDMLDEGAALAREATADMLEQVALGAPVDEGLMTTNVPQSPNSVGSAAGRWGPISGRSRSTAGTWAVRSSGLSVFKTSIEPSERRW